MTNVVAQSDLERTLVRDFLAAVIIHAERCAMLTIAALEAFELVPSCERRDISLPEAFLLELAALAELGCWERAGIRDHIDEGFPTFAEAAVELAQRLEREPEKFSDPRSATLSNRLFQFWLSKFAWDGIAILGADILVSGVNEDLFVESVAEFLWENRDWVSQLFDK